MLSFENGFIFCLAEKNEAIIHNKNSRRHKRELNNAPELYLWSVCEFLGYLDPDEMLMEVQPALPSKDIGEGLTEEWVLLYMIDNQCFNFDYTPKDGDYLVIRNSKKYKFLSFIFRNGAWETGFYYPRSILKLIANGEVRKNEESIY
ncbi:MAG: hypothetical protein MUE81_15605 [Thermoflexibacter sp.]|nr:hypothetical protein [Thermoflexibacter sp.]